MKLRVFSGAQFARGQSDVLLNSRAKMWVCISAVESKEQRYFRGSGDWASTLRAVLVRRDAVAVRHILG